MNISTFTFKGIDIEVTYKKGTLAYVFAFNGENYGNALKPESKKTMDVANCCFLLLTNALESIEALQTNENKWFCSKN